MKSHRDGQLHSACQVRHEDVGPRSTDTSTGTGVTVHPQRQRSSVSGSFFGGAVAPSSRNQIPPTHTPAGLFPRAHPARRRDPPRRPDLKSSPSAQPALTARPVPAAGRQPAGQSGGDGLSAAAGMGPSVSPLRRTLEQFCRLPVPAPAHPPGRAGRRRQCGHRLGLRISSSSGSNTTSPGCGHRFGRCWSHPPYEVCGAGPDRCRSPLGLTASMGRMTFPPRPSGMPDSPFSPAASDQVHQNGLGVVPLVVASRNEGAALPLRCSLQKGVPHLPGTLTPARFPGQQPGRAFPLRCQGNSLASTPISGQKLIPVRRRAEFRKVIVGGAYPIVPCLRPPSSGRHSRSWSPPCWTERTAPSFLGESNHSGIRLPSVTPLRHNYTPDCET